MNESEAYYNKFCDSIDIICLEKFIEFRFKNIVEISIINFFNELNLNIQNFKFELSNKMKTTSDLIFNQINETYFVLNKENILINDKLKDFLLESKNIVQIKLEQLKSDFSLKLKTLNEEIKNNFSKFTENLIRYKFIKLNTLKTHSKYISVITKTKDYLVSASWDKSIKIWNIENPKNEKFSLLGHSNYIYSLVVISDDYIASGAKDQDIKIWNLKSKSCIGTLKGHTSTVSCLLKLNNSKLVSAGWDKIIKIWGYS